MIHELKCHPDPFAAICDGRKTHEWRKDDREPRYEVGDFLVLREVAPMGVSTRITHEQFNYTDRAALFVVTDITRGPDFGMPEGWCCMSIKSVQP